MINPPEMTEFNLDELMHYRSSSHESYLSIDFAAYINDLMQSIAVFGAGIAVLKHGRLEVVAGSSTKVCNINPGNFYTQQTFDNAQVTEMMMPFGSVKHYEQSVINELDVHYYYGVPLFIASNECIGCLFIFNCHSAQLTAQAKLSIKFVVRLLESKMALADAHHVYHEALNFQSMIVNNSDNFIFVKNHKFEIVFANNAFLSMYPEAQRDQVIGYTTVLNMNQIKSKYSWPMIKPHLRKEYISAWRRLRFLMERFGLLRRPKLALRMMKNALF